MKDYYYWMNIKYYDYKNYSKKNLFNNIIQTESFLYHLDNTKYTKARDKVIGELKIFKQQLEERKKIGHYLTSTGRFRLFSIKINTLLTEYQIENLPALILNHQKEFDCIENMQNITRLQNLYRNRTNTVNDQETDRSDMRDISTITKGTRCIKSLDPGQLIILKLSQEIDPYINYTNKPFRKKLYKTKKGIYRRV